MSRRGCLYDRELACIVCAPFLADTVQNSEVYTLQYSSSFYKCWSKMILQIMFAGRKTYPVIRRILRMTDNARIAKASAAINVSRL